MTATPSPIPLPREPLTGPLAPSRAPQGGADPPPEGGRWHLVARGGGLSAEIGGAVIAEAHVWGHSGSVAIEFWVDAVELPAALAAELVGWAFTHPEARPRQPVLVCLPRRDDALHRLALRHVVLARTQDAGPTRMIEGTVADAGPDDAPW